jgi:hypothetical protein
MYEYIFIYIVLPLIIIIKIIDFFCRKHFFHVHLNILDKVVSSLYGNFGTPVFVTNRKSNFGEMLGSNLF